jgi:hypothetical protein
MTQHLGPDDYEVDAPCQRCNGTGEHHARLLQDEPGKGAQGLSRALASKPDARHVVRQAVAAPDVPPADKVFSTPHGACRYHSHEVIRAYGDARAAAALAAHLAPNEDAERLTWQVNELVGLIDEYTSMPCDSLKERMVIGARAAKARIARKQEGAAS